MTLTIYNLTIIFKWFSLIKNGMEKSCFGMWLCVRHKYWECFFKWIFSQKDEQLTFPEYFSENHKQCWKDIFIDCNICSHSSTYRFLLQLYSIPALKVYSTENLQQHVLQPYVLIIMELLIFTSFYGLPNSWT